MSSRNLYVYICNIFIYICIYMYMYMHIYIYPFIIYIYIYIYISVGVFIDKYWHIVKLVFTYILFSYWWYRAGKWQIHSILQRSRSLCCIFIYILNFERERSKSQSHIVLNYFLKLCYFILLICLEELVLVFYSIL